MKDLLKVGLAVFIFAVSLYLSHLLITVLMPLILIITTLLLTIAITRIVVLRHPLILESPYLPLVVLGILIFSAAAVIALGDFIKVLSWFLAGWYIFRVLLYIVAEDMYRDLEELLSGA